MSYSTLRLIELAQTATTDDDTTRVRDLMNKIPLSDEERGEIVRELIRAVARIKTGEWPC